MQDPTGQTESISRKFGDLREDKAADLRIVIVFGIFDPASSDCIRGVRGVRYWEVSGRAIRTGKFLVILKEFVSSKIGSN